VLAPGRDWAGQKIGPRGRTRTCNLSVLSGTSLLIGLHAGTKGMSRDEREEGEGGYLIKSRVSPPFHQKALARQPKLAERRLVLPVRLALTLCGV
jgi:hypothetical protein